jgi:hypothetical protein
MSANVIGKRAGLAEPASTPRQAAATATAAAAAAAATTSATPAASAAPATPAATAAACFLYAALGRRSVLLVEYIERCEADVGDFFLAKREPVTQPSDWRFRRIRRRRDCCGRASYQ